jgi:hypothetical protein
VKKLTRAGLVLNAGERQLRKRSVTMPKLPNLADRGGFTLEFTVKFDELTAGQVLLDSRNAAGRGLVVQTTPHPAVELALSDGAQTNKWRCDAGLLTTNQTHHIGIVVDGGPHIITFVVDGAVCDGGTERQHGWSRFPADLADVNGATEAKITPPLGGQLRSLRIYDRFLRHAELIANFNSDTAHAQR